MGGVLHSYYNSANKGVGDVVPTFPVVEATNTSVETSTTQSHNVALPSGIVAGQLLLVYIRTFQGSYSAPSGYTTVVQEGLFSVFKRITDGSEGSTVTVSADVNGRSAHISALLSGFDASDGGQVEGLSAGNTNTYDPPSITPSWGEGPALYMPTASARAFFNSTNITAAPSGYPEFVSIRSGSGSDGEVSIGMAWREVDAASENPGAFSGQGSAPRAINVAVKGIW